jgi:hypothetical protein
MSLVFGLDIAIALPLLSGGSVFRMNSRVRIGPAPQTGLFTLTGYTSMREPIPLPHIFQQLATQSCGHHREGERIPHTGLGFSEIRKFVRPCYDGLHLSI